MPRQGAGVPPLPTAAHELAALADELEVHPQQLRHFVSLIAHKAEQLQRGPRGAAAHVANLSRARARSAGGKRSLGAAEGEEGDDGDGGEGEGEGDEAAGGGGGAGPSSRSDPAGPSGRVQIPMRAPKRRGAKQQRLAASGGAAVAAAPGAMEGESEAKESRKVQWEPSQRLQLLEVFAAEVLTLTQALTLTPTLTLTLTLTLALTLTRL